MRTSAKAEQPQHASQLTTKAPRFDEFPRLTRERARTLFEEAAEIKRKVRNLEARLGVLKPKIQAELSLALADAEEVKSIVYGDVDEDSGELIAATAVLFTRTAGGETRRLDTWWAVRRLHQKGVAQAEIDEHTKVTEREPGLRVQLLGEAQGGDDAE